MKDDKKKEQLQKKEQKNKNKQGKKRKTREKQGWECLESDLLRTYGAYTSQQPTTSVSEFPVFELSPSSS
jgi:hypothetical protein